MSGTVVHLELHTDDQNAAAAFYGRLLGWRPERVNTSAGSYVALDIGSAFDGGMVECGTATSLWLPYAEVDDVCRSTDTARTLGADVLLEPREGPTGWRSVLRVPHGGEIALWRSKVIR